MTYTNGINQTFDSIELKYDFFQSFSAGEKRCKEVISTDTICPVALYCEPAMNKNGISDKLWRLIKTNKEN